MNQTLTVKGQGQASLPPDYIRVIITLIARDVDYETTVQKATTQLQQLRECLSPLGFKKEDIKTTSFTVDTEYESVRDKDGSYTSVFVGYICRQSLNFGFEINNDKLSHVIRVLSTCPSKPQFSIQYELKDETLLKDIILRNAIENATHRANVLADAANVNLISIQSIEYSWDTIQFQSREFMLADSMKSYSAAMIDIQPNDIEATDSVTVVWRITSV